MSIRLILLIIGAVIVLGIIIDGLWRKRRQELIHRSIYQQELKQQHEVEEFSQQKAQAYAQASTEIDQPTEQLQDEVQALTPEAAWQEAEEHYSNGRIEPTLTPKSEIVEPPLTEEKHHAVQQIIQEELIEDKPEKPVDDFIVLTVMAKANQKFSGFELLQALLKSGLKHGEMNIFHRHRDLDNKSPVYFSVASVTKPGYFDIKNMHKCETKGLNIFMSASDVNDPADAFEIMLATAQQLAEKLDGIVCDRHRAALTPETLATCRSCAKISR